MLLVEIESKKLDLSKFFLKKFNYITTLKDCRNELD